MRLQVNAQESVYTNAMFFVEEYHKPVFKINASANTNDIIAGESANISLTPVYYF